MVPITRESQRYLEPGSHAVKRKNEERGGCHGRYGNPFQNSPRRIGKLRVLGSGASDYCGAPRLDTTWVNIGEDGHAS